MKQRYYLRPELKDELDPPFEILEPAEWRGPIVFNSPHSGSVYPRAFLAAARLEMVTLRRSEDLPGSSAPRGPQCRHCAESSHLLQSFCTRQQKAPRKAPLRPPPHLQRIAALLARRAPTGRTGRHGQGAL